MNPLNPSTPWASAYERDQAFSDPRYSKDSAFRQVCYDKTALTGSRTSDQTKEEVGYSTTVNPRGIVGDVTLSGRNMSVQVASGGLHVDRKPTLLEEYQQQTVEAVERLDAQRVAEEALIAMSMDRVRHGTHGGAGRAEIVK